ncbi:hypothetical protein ACFSR9_04800 [Deinococcus taklimakanensis]|uniref:Apea-like HEPN domain-containing protein n=1 Tax=Deinococcus taklimakanensis TaxID=536443 RepID=A0ABW5P0H5_9DEIO
MAALECRVRERWPNVQVERVRVEARPNSAPDVLRVLARELEQYRHAGFMHVNTSSGTPQMLEALKILRGTEWFPPERVKLWQVDRPEHRQAGTPFIREATTPFLEESLQLKAGFAALNGFDFAGATEIFTQLSERPLELPERVQSVTTLAAVADALYCMDTLNLQDAADILTTLPQHVPALVPLKELVMRGQESDEAWIWLLWGRYHRAWALNRVADALVWAVSLHEVLVVKLGVKYGLPDTDQPLKQSDLPDGLFQALTQEVPHVVAGRGRELKFKGLQEKLAVLRAPSLGVKNVDAFDAGDKDRAAPNPDLLQVRQWRNKVLHQGRAPQPEALDTVDRVVVGMLNAFPFQEQSSREWVRNLKAVPVSADALWDLHHELQDWVG